MLDGTEDEELQELKEVIKEREMTRSFMHDCNTFCEKLRKLYAETSTNCGLLDKPELLRNFDDTELEFTTTQENIKRIRSEIDDIKKKICEGTQVFRKLKEDSRGTIAKKSIENNHRTLTNATTKFNCISPSVIEIQPYLISL